VTLAERFHAAGYATGMFGKWHLGDNYPGRPQDQGFEESLRHRGGGMAQVGDLTTYFRFDSAYFDAVLLKDDIATPTEGYCSDVFTDGALDFMARKKDQPFFLYLAYNAPHTPLQLPQEYEAKYANLQIDSARYPRYERPFPAMNEAHAEDARKVYGMVENIDDNLGRILRQIEALGIQENTLLVFLTDNGPQQRRYNGGFRGLKGSVYEGGIHVPCFFYWPGRMEAGREIDVAAAHIDLHPTLAALCDLPPVSGLNHDGKSLLPLLQGESVPWADRPLFFYWQRGYPEPYRNIAVRKGNFKLVGQGGELPENEAFELFDLSTDRGEMHDLKAEKPEIAAELRQAFDAWHAEVIQSPNLLNPPRIYLGTEQENPSLLNRNDTKGPPGVWAQDKLYGYWDVTVANAGKYDFTFHFHHPLPAGGEMVVRLGTTQRTLIQADSTAEPLHIRQVPLTPGDYRLESWYRRGGDVYLPFYVEVERKPIVDSPSRSR
jgi:arylsulfatase A-like enzyme